MVTRAITGVPNEPSLPEEARLGTVSSGGGEGAHGGPSVRPAGGWAGYEPAGAGTGPGNSGVGVGGDTPERRRSNSSKRLRKVNT
jgi:hypothetical protein